MRHELSENISVEKKKTGTKSTYLLETKLEKIHYSNETVIASGVGWEGGVERVSEGTF